MTLGIDSAFSMVEAASTVIGDSQVALRNGWDKTFITQIVVLFLFLVSTLYTFDTGLYWFDIVDHWINDYCLLSVGFAECIAAGWIYKSEDQARAVGSTSVWVYNIFWFLGLFAGISLAFGLTEPEDNANNGAANWMQGTVGSDLSWVYGLAAGFGCWLIGTGASLALSEAEDAMTSLYTLFWWHGCDDIRTQLNQRINPDWEAAKTEDEFQACLSPSMIAPTFGFFIKYAIPSILMVLVANGARQDSYYDYGGNKVSQNALGYVIYSFTIFLALIPALCPILFMSDLEARDYEGFDLLRDLCCIDVRKCECLGFGTKAQAMPALELQSGGAKI